MRDRGTFGLLVSAATAVLLLASPALAEEPERLSFTHDVRPILMDSCLACHGPDREARRGGLRLDERMAAIESGALVPGDPDASDAIARIFSDDESEVMPPPEHHYPLTDEQKEILQRWVAEGAEYEPHWAFEPIERPAVPDVVDEEWVRNPIDNFVLQRLEAEGMPPAPEADRRTLARRLALDLTGLPPSPEQVEAFLSDDSPNAYDRFVDELMSSVHWGEHRARYWLDLARYADTHGLHFDNFREMWSYRDWVIHAFNQNMPFDQFTLEQLAGDLLPEPELDQLVATGFNRNNITTNEGGTIEEEVLVGYMRDRVETTVTAWMGITASCAACHDHKFDPMSQEEYYQLAAFFNNTTQAAMDGNVPDTPPIVFVPRIDDRERWEQLPEAIAAIEAELDAHEPTAREEFAVWLEERDVVEPVGETVSSENLHLHAPLTRGETGALALNVDGEDRSITADESTGWLEGPRGTEVFSSRGGGRVELAEVGDFERNQAFSFGAWVKFEAGQGGSIFARMNDGDGHRGWDLWVEEGRVGMHLIHRWSEDALKVATQDPLPQNEWVHVFVTYDGSSQASGVSVYVNGESQATNTQQDRLRSTTRTDVPFKLAQRHDSARIDALGVYDVRIYTRKLSTTEVDALANEDQVRALLATESEQLTEPERETLFGWWRRNHDETGNALRGRIADLNDEKQQIEDRGTIAHVMQERDEPATAHVLFRGEYDQRLDEVQAGTPEMLPSMADDLPRNRLGFARWLLTDEHPLTARVTVNRFWQEVFGRGIVETADDFGLAGQFPSHPELLDWLAVEFRESGWDVQDLFRRIVTSATYRQAAVMDERKLEKDPENVLLSRGPRFRMDGEMIRDYALASSDLLVRRIGGPSVRPYQPDGVWEAVAMPGSTTRFYERDSGEALYRRSLYTFWKRAAPPAFLEIFNATNREVCVVTRDRTNTPMQALATLNDVQLVEAARHAAERALVQTGGETDPALDHLADHILLRPLRSDERSLLRASVADLKAFYTGHPAEAPELITYGESEPDESLEPSLLAAWTMLANQLLNLDEVLNK